MSNIIGGVYFVEPLLMISVQAAQFEQSLNRALSTSNIKSNYAWVGNVAWHLKSKLTSGGASV